MQTLPTPADRAAPAGDGQPDPPPDQLARRAPGVAAFAAVALLPLLLLLAGAVAGGVWTWLGLLWMGGASQAADTVLARAFPDAEADRRFPAADALSVILALLHMALLVAVIAAFADAGRPLAGKVALFIGTGMAFGQISNANAHELIHRGSRVLFRLGAAVYVTLLFGHHVSAHRLVHHRWVATDADPNTARLGEGFWRFFPRAWAGSFRAGLEAERALSRRQPGRLNPYAVWVGGAAACLLAVAVAFGPGVAAAYAGLCLYAQMQLMLSDYVQHYGLRRRMLADGRPEPVNPRHSWDAPHPVSSLMMVNAPRHSDHHSHPTRIYPALQLARDAAPRPMLPYSLPVMAALALSPTLWRRVMDRRVARMREG